MMKTRFRILLLIVFFLLATAGCHRLASTSSIDLRRFTPGVETQETTNIETTPIPETTSGLTLDSAVKETLRIYPLGIGSSWVYQYLGYDESREVIWRVVETVVDSGFIEGYYLVEMERTAELVEGYAPDGFLSTPETGTFWYLVDGVKMYRYKTEVDLDFSSAWLDLVIPFPGPADAWYPNPNQRVDSAGSAAGSRSASDPFKKVLPMGGTYTCYNIATQYPDRTEEGTFCETVGFVYKESTHFDLVSGYRMELEGYTLQ